MPVSRARVREMFTEVVADAKDKFGVDIRRDEYFSLTFSNTKRAAGQCNYTTKEVKISRHHIAVNDEDVVLETIRHEVAHALCPGQGHNDVWRRTLLKLGGTGAQYVCEEANRPQHAWEVIDKTSGEVVAKYYRKPRRNFATAYLRGRPETKGNLILRKVE